MEDEDRVYDPHYRVHTGMKHSLDADGLAPAARGLSLQLRTLLHSQAQLPTPSHSAAAVPWPPSSLPHLLRLPCPLPHVNRQPQGLSDFPHSLRAVLSATQPCSPQGP